MLWKLIGKVVSRPAVANWLIQRALKTPYTHLSKDGSVYMERYWLFNSYERGPKKQEKSKYWWCPVNIRLHWIRRPDSDRHMHDHPWNARTIILRGGYVEQRREIKKGVACEAPYQVYERRAGDSAKLGFGEYHRITQVQPGGAWTLFISGPYKGVWGFLVDGVKVQWRTYLGLDK